MSKDNYIFDKDGMKVRKSRTSVKQVVVWIFRLLFVSVFLAFFYYVILSLFIRTDVESKLRQENRMYKKIYPEMLEKEALVADAIEQLQIRDNQIYGEIFHTQAPTIERLSSMKSLFSNDTIPDADIVNYSADKLAALEKVGSRVEDNFMEIYKTISAAAGKEIVLPMQIPLKDISYAQVGASTGLRLSPIYKVEVAHDGIDLISSAGTPVYAAAPGVVTSVVRSMKGKGNTVTIEHKGGYVTKYSHLSDIAVGRGRRVSLSTLIGNVGSTGNTLVPHLHYEVWRDTVSLDPINFFFGSVDPDEYARMLIMSVSTKQSLD